MCRVQLWAVGQARLSPGWQPDDSLGSAWGLSNPKPSHHAMTFRWILGTPVAGLTVILSLKYYSCGTQEKVFSAVWWLNWWQDTIFMSHIYFPSNFQDGKYGAHQWQRTCSPWTLKTWSKTISNTAQSPWAGHSTFLTAGNRDVPCCRGCKACHGETDHTWQRCCQPHFESCHLSKSQ